MVGALRVIHVSIAWKGIQGAVALGIGAGLRVRRRILAYSQVYRNMMSSGVSRLSAHARLITARESC
jgi:hypothetical protein